MGNIISLKDMTIKDYLKHIEKKKDYYFGKDEFIYRFYEGQVVLLKDLILKGLVKLIVLCFLLSGCIHSSIKYQQPIHNHNWDKDTGKCWICGETYKPIIIIKKKVIRLNSKQAIIKAIMKESSLTESEASVLWERYKKSGKKSFLEYLIEFNPYEGSDRVYSDFMDRVKSRTKILKRGYREK